MSTLVKNSVWNYRNGELFCEGVELGSIARRVGTPVYVYSHTHLVNRFREVERAWSGRKHLICFSLKANSNLAVIRTFVGLGAGIDILSGGELFRARTAGAPADKIVFAGVGKTRKEIEAALREGILFFTVESFAELGMIDEVARKKGAVAPVSLRVTPDVDPRTHKYITTGKAENKFGVDLARAFEFYKQCRQLKGVKAVGIHMHIGSQILQTRPYREGVKKLVALVGRLKDAGIRLRYLDIGGGMGVSYRGEEVPPARDYARALLPLLKNLRLTVILEPGRYLTANAGCLLVKVLRVKKKGGKNFIVEDGGMNDLIRPALYGSHHGILPVEKGEGKTIRADVVGPVCESGDFFAQSRQMDEPEPGDLLAVMGAGAYGFVMSSNYNSRPRAAEVMVKGEQFRVVRRRETYRDLVKGEKVPDFLIRGSKTGR